MALSASQRNKRYVNKGRTVHAVIRDPKAREALDALQTQFGTVTATLEQALIKTHFSQFIFNEETKG